MEEDSTDDVDTAPPSNQAVPLNQASENQSLRESAESASADQEVIQTIYAP